MLKTKMSLMTVLVILSVLNLMNLIQTRTKNLKMIPKMVMTMMNLEISHFHKPLLNQKNLFKSLLNNTLILIK
jgi:hypothetical protein